MSARYCFSVAFLGGTAHALAFGGPKETRPHMPFNAMSPMPTIAPIIYGALAPHQLARRADETNVLIAPDNTCGYVSGTSIASFTCGDKDVSCVLVSSIGSTNGLVGCCGVNDCGFRTTCVDSSQIEAGSCGNLCLENTNIIKCSASSAAFCNSVSFSGGAVDYFCAPIQESTFLEVKTTFDGQSSRAFKTVDLGQLAETSNGDVSSSSSDFPTAITGGVDVVTSYSTFLSSPTGDIASGGGTNIGAIVGGVVGVVAVLLLIALGLWLLLHKRKCKQSQTQDINIQPVSSAGPGPALQPAPPQTGYAQPKSHQSMYPPGYQQGHHDTSPTGYQNTFTPGWYGGKAGAGQKNLTHAPNRFDSISPTSDPNSYIQQPISPSITTRTPSYIQIQKTHATPVETDGNPVSQNRHHKGQIHEMGY